MEASHWLYQVESTSGMDAEFMQLSGGHKEKNKNSCTTTIDVQGMMLECTPKAASTVALNEDSSADLER